MTDGPTSDAGRRGRSDRRPRSDPATLEIVRHALGLGRRRDGADHRPDRLLGDGPRRPRLLDRAHQRRRRADRAGARHRAPSRLVPVGRRRTSRAPTATASQPGDVFILNDPYGWGGIHLPDIYLIKPIFHDGVVRALRGGASPTRPTSVALIPGSNSTTTTEIFQEGLRLPGVHLYEAGRVNQAVLDIIAANVRVPHMVLGDIRAQLAAVDAGERGYLDLIRRYGAERAGRARGRAADPVRADGPARDRVVPRRRLPPGQLDRQRQRRSGPDPDRGRADGRRRRHHGRLRGHARRQVRGGINSPLPFTRSAVYAATRLVLDRVDPELGRLFPGHHGHRRRGHSVVNPRLPGGVRRTRDHRLPGHGCGVGGARPGRARPRARPTARAATRSSRSVPTTTTGSAVRLRRHVLGRPRRRRRLRRAVGCAAPGLEQRQHADRDRREHLPAPFQPLRDRRGHRRAPGNGAARRRSSASSSTSAPTASSRSAPTSGSTCRSGWPVARRAARR